MDKQQTNQHPVVIFVRGLPGSGKSYIAQELQKVIGMDNVVMLDPDATDYDSADYLEHVKVLTSKGIDPKLHAYRFLRAKAYAGIESGKIIIWNQPFTNLEIFNKMVARLRTCAEQNNVDLPILVVEVQVDNAIAKERIEKRKQAGGHGPSDSTFIRFANDYTTFATHGYNTLTVSGEDDLAISISTINNALQKLATV